MSRIKIKIAAVAALGLLALAIAGCGSSEKSPDAMSGDHMSHAMGSTGATMSGTMDGGSMSNDNMSGSSTKAMTPLVAGADGTSPKSDNLFLTADSTSLTVGKQTMVTLTITDASTGKPVKKFEVDQTKVMHLIVVNHDFTGFQHLHPALQSDGRFTVMITLPRAGMYRAISDFTTGGKRYALGVDLDVPGKSKTTPLPAPSTSASVDGYDVRLAHGDLMAKSEATLAFTVSSGGKPVTALQPYLGAYGHLVALRKPDLAYSHVHPVEDDKSTGKVTFAADFLKAGTYRLYFQFRVKNAVHVAPFTVVVK